MRTALHVDERNVFEYEVTGLRSERAQHFAFHARSAGTAQRLVEARAARPWLGTLVEVAATAASGRLARAGVEAAFAAIARVHRALSVHDRASELSRINRVAVYAPQPVSDDLRHVLACALELAARSRGSFDPTVGARLAALGFLPPQPCADPTASWRDIELGAHGVRYHKRLVIDLGGIAKGYAVDCAVDALTRHGAISGRVNAGGDLRVFGGRSEPIHVRAGGRLDAVLPLAILQDGAVATSAYGGQRRLVDGRWATPLIDPRVGLPRMSTRTVSVLAPTCMLADALTKVVALNGAAAARLLKAYAASAAILSPLGKGFRCTTLPHAA